MLNLNRRSILIASLLLWLAMFALSFLHAGFSEPSGDGFTRGLNRIAAFFGWQIAAGILGILICLYSRAHHHGKLLMWASRLPATVFAMLVASLIAVFFYVKFANVAPPPEGQAAKPTTQIPMKP